MISEGTSAISAHVLYSPFDTNIDSQPVIKFPMDSSTLRVPQFAGAAWLRHRRSRYHPSPAVMMVAPAPMRLDGTPTIRTKRCPGSSTAVPGTNGARKKGPQYAMAFRGRFMKSKQARKEKRGRTSKKTSHVTTIPYQCDLKRSIGGERCLIRTHYG